VKRIPAFTLTVFIALLAASPVFADGVDDLFEQSATMAGVITTGIAIAFGAGFLINLSRAQLARGTGDSLGYSRALQQGIGMVILLALSANTELIAKGLSVIGSGIDVDPSSSKILTGVWEQLAKFFTSSILGGVGVFTTVSALGSGMAGHISSIIGSPAGISSTISNGVVIIGGGLLTLMSVLVANSIIETVFLL
jgi:hypothetical protein